MPLRIADTKTSVRVQDGDDWLDLRANISKREANMLTAMMPDSLMDPGIDITKDQIVLIRSTPELAKALFSILVVGWSLGKPSLEVYLSLEPDSATWVDGKLFEHWNELNASKEELGEVTASPKD
jgi:hypothetical protein